MSYGHRKLYRNGQRRFSANSRNITRASHMVTWLSVFLIISATCLVRVDTATTAATITDCVDDPPAIGNGHALNVGTQGNGTVAVYVCDQGYTLTGNVNSVKCTLGVWAGVRPKCELPETTGDTSYVTIPDIILYSAIGLGGLLVILLVIVITFCCCFFCKSRPPNRSINPMMPQRRYYEPPPPDQPQKMVVPVVAAKY